MRKRNIFKKGDLLYLNDVFQLFSVRGKESSKCLKITSLENIDHSFLKEEIEKLSRIGKHSNIVKYSSHPPFVCTKVAINELWIPIEENIRSNEHYYNLGEVLRTTTLRSESSLSVLAQSLLKGLKSVHSINYIIKDLQPCSIWFVLEEDSSDKVHIKIDPISLHGHNTVTKDRRRLSFSGNPLRASPELIDFDKDETIQDDLGVSIKNDIYSLGILLLESYTGTLPRSELHVLGGINSIIRNDPSNNEKEFTKLFGSQKKYDSASQSFKEFLKLCLTKSPSERPNSSELLNHDFITKYVNVDTTIFQSIVKKQDRIVSDNSSDSDDESTTDSVQDDIPNGKQERNVEDELHQTDSDVSCRDSSPSKSKVKSLIIESSNPPPKAGHHFYLSPVNEEEEDDTKIDPFWDQEVNHSFKISNRESNNEKKEGFHHPKKFGISKIYKKKKTKKLSHRDIAPFNVFCVDRNNGKRRKDVNNNNNNAPFQVKKRAPMQVSAAPRQVAPMQAAPQQVAPMQATLPTDMKHSQYNVQMQQQQQLKQQIPTNYFPPQPMIYNNSFFHDPNNQPNMYPQQSMNSNSNSNSYFGGFSSSSQIYDTSIMRSGRKSSISTTTTTPNHNNTNSEMSFLSSSASSASYVSSGSEKTAASCSSITDSSFYSTGSESTAQHHHNNKKKVTELEKRFIIIRFLGGGSFGKVFMVQYKNPSLHKTRGIIAVKRIECQSIEGVNSFIKEMFVLKKIKNPNIITVYDGFVERYGNFFYCNLEMEYLNGGDASKLMNEKIIQEEFIINMLRQIGNALKEIHSQKIVHRDISLRNICLLLKDERLLKKSEEHEDPSLFIDQKIREIATTEENEGIHGYPIKFLLVDFGFVRDVEGTMSKSFNVGTFQFLSPEQALLKPYGCKADIFSLGACIFALVTKIKGQVVAHLSVCKKNELKGLDSYSNGLIELMWRMLEIDPEKRINANELVDLVQELE